MDLLPIQLIFTRLPLFVLVLFRMGGMMALAPLLGSVAIPVRVRLCLTLVLSMAVFPLVPPVAFYPGSVLSLAVAIGAELLIGIAMGFAISLIFLGVQLGAELIGYQMGLSLARLIDPMSEVSTTALSQFFIMLTTLFYVLINGHVILIRSLAGTFQSIPLLTGFDVNPLIRMFTDLVASAFRLGIRMAGPAMIALFLASLSMGFISRTMPQLNILAAGFPVRILLGLLALLGSFSMICLLIQDQLSMILRQIAVLFL